MIKRKKHRKKGEPKLESPPQFNYFLYDLSKDIGKKNLADENPELVKAMIKRMEELVAEVEMNARAPWEKKEPEEQ